MLRGMSRPDRKALLREYKENPRPAGVFAIRNTVTGRLLIGAALNLPGMLNRQRFELQHGSHPDRELQADWKRLGPDAFMIEELDRLDAADDAAADRAGDLRALQGMWMEKLGESGAAFYSWTTRI
jgi:hypothetical protein